MDPHRKVVRKINADTSAAAIKEPQNAEAAQKLRVSDSILFLEDPIPANPSRQPKVAGNSGDRGSPGDPGHEETMILFQTSVQLRWMVSKKADDRQYHVAEVTDTRSFNC